MNQALLSIDVQTWLQLEPSIQMEVCSQLIDPLKSTLSIPTHRAGLVFRGWQFGFDCQQNLYDGSG